LTSWYCYSEIEKSPGYNTRRFLNFSLP